MTAPPSDGAVHESDTPPLPGIVDNPVGAIGAERGVADADARENDPVPTEFTAAVRKMYEVPLVKDETVAEVVEENPSTTVTHEVPALDEY